MKNWYKILLSELSTLKFEILMTVIVLFLLFLSLFIVSPIATSVIDNYNNQYGITFLYFEKISETDFEKIIDEFGDFIDHYEANDLFSEENTDLQAVVYIENKSDLGIIGKYCDQHQIEYSKDENYEKNLDVIKILSGVLYVLSIVFFIVLIIVINSLFLHIIDKRKNMIFRLKILGASDWKISSVYFLLLLPFALFSICTAIIAAKFEIIHLNTVFQQLFSYTLTLSIDYVLISIFIFAFLTFSLLILRLNLGMKRSKIVYSLIKQND